ncbi:MAG: hypothetical protein CM15mP85_04690 [Rhodobacterales bacterium]|nr:MAG: hypothetical protein CM15mP85_04690 [Rhodobacterales bacterium]
MLYNTQNCDDFDDVIAANLICDDCFADDAFFTMDEDADIGARHDIVVRHALGSGQTYEIVTVPAEDADKTAIINNSNLTSTDQLVVGMAFTMTGDYELTGALQVVRLTRMRSRTELSLFKRKINTARVQAGSQYAALESAVTYTTDLTAQYELAYNTVHDVNFSMETAHMAKNQILQQAATAMLAQANEGQQGLLQLIQ